jgi:hypothetical protein
MMGASKVHLYQNSRDAEEEVMIGFRAIRACRRITVRNFLSFSNRS